VLAYITSWAREEECCESFCTPEGAAVPISTRDHELLQSNTTLVKGRASGKRHHGASFWTYFWFYEGDDAEFMQKQHLM
jgi:hypothetical protein